MRALHVAIATTVLTTGLATVLTTGLPTGLSAGLSGLVADAHADARGPAAPPAGPPADSVAGVLRAAAGEASVPPDLLLAIAIEEGGVRLAAHRALDDDDLVPVAGALELRHGRLDTLALGARLMGTTEEALRADTDLASRAGARVLATLGAQYGAGADLASWRRALEVLSGMDDANARAYADRVLGLLHRGGSFPARAGEVVVLAAHPELVEAAAPLLPPPATMPDYPGAIWFETSCNNKCTPGRPLGNGSVDKIVIHDTEGGWDGSVATLQFDGGKSVQYIVDADGSRVGQFRPETDTAWHAGNFFYNETSIGIEHVGVASDPDGYSTGLYARSRDLVQNIRSRWAVPLDRAHIIGHYQVPDGDHIAQMSPPCDGLDRCESSANYGGASNHRDPGYYWQWCQYMQALGGTCTCADTWPLWNCTTDHTEAVRCSDGVVQIEQCADGCEVMPIGTDDVCHGVVGPGPDAGVDVEVDAGADGGNAADGGATGGCGCTGAPDPAGGAL
ncbi:MAG TPA: N-acetylmuramoyl-L-alanine amidase, partial [Kofleriaceae bacterium]|nr:N-acetylmuramoyl-L-alanine amidase [Kofleriaceae bacterium]